MSNNLKNLSDEELVRFVCVKDKQGYSEVVERYQEKLLRYAEFLVKDEQKAQDIVQDAFIKAFKNLKSFDTKRKFSSWIYRIVHNEAINEIKKTKRFVSIEKIGSFKNLIVEDELIEKLTKKEIKKLITESLSKLDVKYSEGLILFYLEEKSYEEISDILRLPMGTVGTRIKRGKKMLSKIVLNMKGGDYGKK